MRRSGNDPLGPNSILKMFGAAGLGRGGDAPWEMADVFQYNSGTHTASVRTHKGRPLNDVPQLRFGSGDYEHLKTGTTVVLSWDLGFPIILGTINMPAPPQTALDSPSMTGINGVGVDNPLQPTDGTNNYRPAGAPIDMMQGDWAKVGTLGNHIGVLEGGVTSFGSPTAVVRSLGVQGLLQFVASRIETITDFGLTRVENNKGTTSLTFRGGANQVTQTGLDEQNWTIRLDLGATGDLVDFQVTDPQGTTLFKLHVGPDGKLELFTAEGLDMSSGGDMTLNVAGKRTTEIDSDDTATIGGGVSKTIGKNVTESITTDRAVSIGNNDSTVVNSDQTVSVGGNRVDVVTGGAPEEATPGNNALTTKILNGGWLVTLGDPSSGANISAQAAYSLKTFLGDISFDAGMGMSLKAKLLMQQQAQLITLNGEQWSLMRSEDFLRDLGQFLAILLPILNSGITSAPGAPVLPTLAGVMPQLTQFISKCTAAIAYVSQKVKNG